jgi:ActR/RegA family two-component response regulator
VKVLVVEDDPFKLDAVIRVVQRVGSGEIQVAKSLRGAMVALEKEVFDFVVLDMAIPSHTSDVGAVDTYSQPVGGLDVLLFLANNARRERVAILTQYPTVEYDRRHVALKDLTRILHEDGVANLVGAILFSDKEDWEKPLLVAMGATN